MINLSILPIRQKLLLGMTILMGLFLILSAFFDLLEHATLNKFVLYYGIRAVIRYFILQDTRVFFYHGTNEDDYGLVPKLLNAIHVSVFVAVAFFYFYTKSIKSKTDILISVLLVFMGGGLRVHVSWGVAGNPSGSNSFTGELK